MGIADANNKVPVTLAGRDFVVKVVPMARIRKLASVLTEAVKQADAIDTKNADEDSIEALVDKVLEYPHRLLSVFIDDLPEDIFTDEEQGVTFAEFWDVLQIALRINRLDALKNAFTRLAPLLSQASPSQKTN